jgi:hypothetical protein
MDTTHTPYDYTPKQAEMLHLYERRTVAFISKLVHDASLKRLRLWTGITETAAALSSSSAVAGLFLWQSQTGRLGFAALVAIAALASVIRASFRLTEGLDHHSRQSAAWTEILLGLDRIAHQARAENDFTERLRILAADLEERFHRAELADGPRPETKLLRAYQEQAERAFPPESLWLPPA